MQDNFASGMFNMKIKDFHQTVREHLRVMHVFMLNAHEALASHKKR